LQALLVRGGERVDARRCDAVQCGRQRHLLHPIGGDDDAVPDGDEPGVEQGAQQFLQEERVALRLLQDEAPHAGRQALHREEAVDEIAALEDVERSQGDVEPPFRSDCVDPLAPIVDATLVGTEDE
jgi:hypothetical protein